jgi:hypothetical protein
MSEEETKSWARGTKRVDDLEVNEDLDFQRHLWRFQRVGLVAMALVVVAALLGLFGGRGLLAQGKAGSNDEASLSVREYDRFVRFMKPTELRVQLEPGAASGGEARVWLDREYIEGVQIQRVSPQPDDVEGRPDRLTYVFKVNELDEPTAVTLNMMPQRFGLLQGQAGIEGEEPVNFNQFVYP